MPRQKNIHPTKTTKINHKPIIPNKIVSLTKNNSLHKNIKPSKSRPNHYPLNPPKLPNLRPNNLSNASSLKTLSITKINNINCSNPQIKPTKTAPCVFRNSTSVQNHKQLSLNSKEKTQILIHKEIKNQKATKDEKSLQIKKTLAQRHQRKNMQEIVSRSKTCSKNKSKEIKNLRDQTQLKSQLKNNPNQMIYQSRSSCITRNISKNNSKQKDHIHEDLSQKFKKKDMKNQEKKLKKQAVYASMKISKRNSFKFLETQKDLFVVFKNPQESKNSQNIQNQNFQKRKEKTIQVNLLKIKSLRNIDLLSMEEMQIDYTKEEKIHEYKRFDQQNEKHFSFNENKIDQKRDNNLHEISIENFLQCHQTSFRIESEQSLKERLTRYELSLEQLKQQQFPNLQQIHSLNQFQNTLQTNQHFSLTNQITTFLTRIFCTLKYPHEKNAMIKRIETIDWISIISSTMLLTTETFQLAVAYFDVYTYDGLEDNENHDCEDLKLIGLTCLTIAIKMDERQLEHDIFNAFATLQVGFSRQQIVKTQQVVVKKLKLKLKIQTLSFWLDSISLSWDHFLKQNSSDEQQMKNLQFKSLQGKSYQNYRRALEMCNSILLEGQFYNYSAPHLILSIIFVICQENIQKANQQRVFQQINNFNKNLHKITQDSKQNLLSFATQQTLDQFSISDSKQNLNTIDNIQQIDNKLQNEGKKQLKRITRNDNKGLNHKPEPKFNQVFEQFVRKYINKDMTHLQKEISYVKPFIDLKFVLEVDPRVYQQAQTYEDFMRYHSYSPHAKVFVIKRIKEKATQE